MVVVTPAMSVKPTNTFVLELMKLIKTLTFTDTCTCGENCFSILHSTRTKYTRKLKDGMYMKWLQSAINKQKKCLPSFLEDSS